MCYENNDTAAMVIVEKRASEKAWQQIKKYWPNKNIGWYVDNNAIYFLIQNKNQIIYKRIDFKTGNVTDSQKVNCRGFDMKEAIKSKTINTLDNYRFEVDSRLDLFIYDIKDSYPDEGYIFRSPWGWRYEEEIHTEFIDY